MATPSSVGEALARVRDIESRQKIYSIMLSPVRCRLVGDELALDDPVVTTERFVAPQSAWAAVKAEVEARIQSLEDEKAALEAMPTNAVVLPEFPGLGEAASPSAPPAEERRRRLRSRPLLSRIPAGKAAA